MMRQRGTGTAREQLEAVVQTGIDFLDRQRVDTSGRQFQRQRNAVQVDAKRGNRWRPSLRQNKPGLLQARPLDK